VLIDGQQIPKASSDVSIEKEVIELRDGGSDIVQVIPGPVTYRVCIEASELISAIGAACAPNADDPFLDIVVEDGRSFARCLVESSRTGKHETHGSGKAMKRRSRYCLRCEGTQ
jgi:hypothetical protein